ncbi:MAG: hypothetical protein XD93_0927 [candidate division WS6 bacterium 34_10]|uniref:Uncharacterized protein n=1 Tax=candidate division WS6 bacterium 34_10 TaxID=1641389 RepID=A0A124FWZ2_9BACT|nr:MAG: hypothetical protein XD93_0927 [candidate division WS6 bacterium 34_10]
MTPENQKGVEAEQEDNFSPLIDRSIEILKYKNDFPDKEWQEIPELVYIDIEGNGQIDTLKKIDVIEFGEERKLLLDVYYQPSEIPINKVRDIIPYFCRNFTFIVKDSAKEQQIRELEKDISFILSFDQEPSLTKEQLDMFIRDHDLI